MYYPLLRGRQFELIALRELSNDGVLDNVITPVIEPVKSSFNNLNLAFKIFKKKNQRILFIVNPVVGEVDSDSEYYLEYLKENNYGNVIPAFYYHINSNLDYLRNSVEKYSIKNFVLILDNEVSADDGSVQEVINIDECISIILNDPDKNRSLKRLIKDKGKELIRLDDLFEPEQRNSDYLNSERKRFSEEHLYYTEEGYSGFSDYTLIPSPFSEGGSTPRAVVIHLSFLSENNQIWLCHFTSVTNDSIANIQGKFSEALEKAVEFINENQQYNSATEELLDYYDKAHYPGLGTIKKISIKNHLILLSNYLNEL